MPVQDSAYSSFGAITGTADRLEAPRPDPSENRIAMSEILDHFHWTDQEYQVAKKYGFPEWPGNRFGSGPYKNQAYWPRDLVMAWAVNLVAFAGTLSKRRR
jgi:hypothetical protein